jgi:biotin carboxylase
VRELARGGFEVTLATPLPPETRFLSRYCRQIPAPWSPQDPLAFAGLISDNQSDLVLPLSEDIMGALWKLPRELTSRVFPATTPLQQQALSDRTQMYALATSAGVPVPGMAALGSEHDLEAALSELGSPIVLRGTQGLAGLQVKIVDTVDVARTAYRQLTEFSPGAPFAQEFVKGRRFLVGGLFHEGEMLQYFAQTTVEAIRPPTGPSIRIRSVYDQDLIRYTDQVFRALSWTGLACAEFMQGSDGKFKFLEINPRPWAAIYAAHCCGVPLLRTFSEYLLGDRSRRQSDYIRSREVVLFPQYLSARIAAEQFPSWRDVPSYLASLRGAPWGSPPLLLHMLRRAFWSRKG